MKPRQLMMWAAAVVAGGMVLAPATADAGESATSVYLLGSKGAMAGFTPPPGLYVADANYYYSGSASGTAAKGVALPRLGGNVSVDIEVDGKAYYNIPTAVWVAPQQVLGGNIGFSLMMPIGWKDVGVDLTAQGTFTLPPPLGITLNPGLSFSFGDDKAAFGDPLLGSFVGWHSGNWHWNVGVLVNVPVGQWETGQLANIGFNRWAFDFTSAVTWLDPKTGFELSGAAGVTFNSENHDTDYKSGTDFHLEFAAIQHFSKQFAVGLVGYHYQQLTGDSGAGAVLGDFKGRVTALGPTITYDFMVGQVPVMTSLKWMHEFNVENRLKGDMGMLTLTVPLGPSPK